MPRDHEDADARSGSTGAPIGPQAIITFLRALADRVERDDGFGRQIAALMAESGLPAVRTRRRGTAGQRTSTVAANAEPPGAPNDLVLPDPYAVLRAGGAERLRTVLDTLDVAALRKIVRSYRLDPSRVSVRWNNRARLMALIVEQVSARADHGKAFSRI